MAIVRLTISDWHLSIPKFSASRYRRKARCQLHRNLSSFPVADLVDYSTGGSDPSVKWLSRKRVIDLISVRGSSKLPVVLHVSGKICLCVDPLFCP